MKDHNELSLGHTPLLIIIIIVTGLTQQCQAFALPVAYYYMLAHDLHGLHGPCLLLHGNGPAACMYVPPYLLLHMLAVPQLTLMQHQQCALTVASTLRGVSFSLSRGVSAGQQPVPCE